MARGARTAGQSNGTAPQGRYADVGARASQAAAWHTLDHEQLGEMALAMAQAGDAVLIGATSDGGAFKLVLFSGDGKAARYAATADEANELVRHVLQLATEAANDTR